MSFQFNLCSSLEKYSVLVKMTIRSSIFFFNLEVSCARFSLIVARLRLPGEACLHKYIYLLENYSDVYICSEFKHSAFFLIWVVEK